MTSSSETSKFSQASSADASAPTGGRRRLRIAVYGISKNEERHVARFMGSVRDADQVLIADTGSTDATVAALRSAGAVVQEVWVSPWRFDDARNAALWLLGPEVDVCVALDLDQILTPGWREELERVWTPQTTRVSYSQVFSWNADGSPGLVFFDQRIHSRRGYRWKMPIHEVPMWCGAGAESIVTATGLEVHHHPDPTKSRSSYLPMLEQAAVEYPDDPRAAHYLGREYYYAQQHAQAIAELQRSLDLPKSTWKPQRAEACRIIGKCLKAQGKAAEALTWHWQAVAECPGQREPWVDLSLALYQSSDFAGGYYAAQRALAFQERSRDYINEAAAWGAQPHDLLSVCAWQIGLHDLAAEHAVIAARLAPGDKRMQENLDFFQRRGSTAKAGE